MSAQTIAGRAALLLCGFLAVPCWGADEPSEPDFSLSVGMDFSRGDFGTDAVIEDTLIALGFTAVFERAAFTVSVPYLSVDTTSEGITTTESGLGDISASLHIFT